MRSDSPAGGAEVEREGAKVELDGEQEQVGG